MYLITTNTRNKYNINYNKNDIITQFDTIATPDGPLNSYARQETLKPVSRLVAIKNNGN